MKRDPILTIKLPSPNGMEEFAIHEPKEFQKPKKPFTREASLPRMSSPIRSPRKSRGSSRRSTGTRPSPTAGTCGRGLRRREAMDTAQRGMGLDWTNSLELIRRSIQAADKGNVVASGAGTRSSRSRETYSITGNHCAYEEQCTAIEKLGGRIILMASRALAASAKSPDDYGKVYDRILSQVKQPVIIHWLGEMFDPALEGYWGKKDHLAAMDVLPWCD